MTKIYKYELQPVEIQTITLPYGAEVLSAVEQNDKMVMYAMIDPFENKETLCHVQVYATGSDIDETFLQGYKFINTVKMFDGKLMFHVFAKVL